MVIEKLKSWLSPSPKTSTQVIPLDQLAEYVGGQYDSFGLWSGDKFPGGFGVTKDYTIKDYWVLRLRSKQLFEENLYARGMIRRLVTNEINKGLALEATPDSSILGIDDDEVGEWAENIERRFLIWNQSPFVCDFRKQRTFGAIQRQARMMALISGDVLVVLVPNQYGLPSVELVDASYVTTPNNDKMIREASNRGNEIVHGVEVSNTGEHVAFYIQQKDGTHKRLAAYGNRTGRRMAWLYYGTERMIDDVRGTSILACVMQSLKELDRYRDSELRAAVINSMVAMWIEKTEDKMGTLPITGGAVRKDVVQTQNDCRLRTILKDVKT